MKTVVEVMKRFAVDELNEKTLELLDIEEGETVNNETGEVSQYVKLEAEVPRGHGKFSRCRIPVKIVNGRLKVKKEQLEDSEFLVTFKGLNISYIDTKGNAYFKAESYDINEIE